MLVVKISIQCATIQYDKICLTFQKSTCLFQFYRLTTSVVTIFSLTRCSGFMELLTPDSVRMSFNVLTEPSAYALSVFLLDVTSSHTSNGRISSCTIFFEADVKYIGCTSGFQAKIYIQTVNTHSRTVQCYSVSKQTMRRKFV